MHELAVTENIVGIVARHAEKAGARRVLRIHLVVGELASIVDDSVQFYFDFVSRDTPAAGAQLCFRRLPASLECQACGHRWEPRQEAWVCPACGATQARVVSGREFYVDSIEVE